MQELSSRRHGPQTAGPVFTEEMELACCALQDAFGHAKPVKVSHLRREQGACSPRRRSQCGVRNEAGMGVDSVLHSVQARSTTGLEPCAPSKSTPLCCSLDLLGCFPQHRASAGGLLLVRRWPPGPPPQVPRPRHWRTGSHGLAGKGRGFDLRVSGSWRYCWEVLLKGCVSPNCLSFPWGHKTLLALTPEQC